MDVEYQLSAKRLERNVLEAELAEEELWHCEEYQRLEQQIATLQAHQEGESETPPDGNSASARDRSAVQERFKE